MSYERPSDTFRYMAQESLDATACYVEAVTYSSAKPVHRLYRLQADPGEARRGCGLVLVNATTARPLRCGADRCTDIVGWLMAIFAGTESQAIAWFVNRHDQRTARD